MKKVTIQSPFFYAPILKGLIIMPKSLKISLSIILALGSILACIVAGQSLMTTAKQAEHNEQIKQEKQLFSHLKTQLQTTINHDKIEAQIGVYDETTHHIILVNYPNQIEGMPLGDTVKLAVLVNQLHNQRTFTPSDQVLADKMLRHQNNAATNQLLQAQGGYQAPDQLFEQLNMPQTIMDPNNWQNSYSTASDQITFLRQIFYDSNLLSDKTKVMTQQLMTQDNLPNQGVGQSDLNVSQTDDQTWIANKVGHVKSSQHDYVFAILSDHHINQKDGLTYVSHLSQIINDSLH